MAVGMTIAHKQEACRVMTFMAGINFLNTGNIGIRNAHKQELCQTRGASKRRANVRPISRIDGWRVCHK